MARKKKAPPAPVVDAKIEEEVQAIVQAAPPPDPTPLAKPPVRRYTLAETRDQLRSVEELLIEGAKPAAIHRLFRAESKYPSITMSRVHDLCARVRTDWLSIAKDDDRKAARSAAIVRIHRMRQQAAGQWDQATKSWVIKPNHQAVARYEELLMKLEGSEQAAKVEVDVRYTQAMLAITAQLTGDDASAFLEEAMDQKRLADMAKRELPALVERIPTGSVVEAEVVPASKGR